MSPMGADVMFDHEKLDVYRVSLEFAAWTYRLCKELKGSDRFGRDQMLRASQSIPQNIAEGNGKRSGPDRRRYFEISRGSALECASILDILVACKVITEADAGPGKKMLLRIVAMLSKMTASSEKIREEGLEYGKSDYDYEHRSAEHEHDKEKGFALIASLLALWILAALGILVFTVTTQDVRISSKTVGEKKAFLAAESGTGWLMQNFNPANLGASAVTNQQIDYGSSTSATQALIDQNSKFSITKPAPPTSGPAALPSPGYEIGGGEVWGQTRYVATVTGNNSNYNTTIPIQVGIGFGPVDITTLYR